jgi:hypothetical protein
MKARADKMKNGRKKNFGIPSLIKSAVFFAPSREAFRAKPAA